MNLLFITILCFVSFSPSGAFTVLRCNVKTPQSLFQLKCMSNVNNNFKSHCIINNHLNVTTDQIKYINPWIKLFLSYTIITLLPRFAFASSIPKLSAKDISGVVKTGMEYYSKYFLAGGICASFSHGISVPLDVVKTRKQLSKEMAKLSIVEAFKKIISDDGLGMLYKGLGPTLLGYSVQGALKYGFYEIFKKVLMSSAFFFRFNQFSIYMMAGACAEMIGSSFLSPFEACRIRLVADPKYANGLFSCLKKLVDTEGIESLYRGLPAILVKQLPYTIVKLSTFETTAAFLSKILIAYDSKTNFRLIITFFSAMLAAVLASIVSQPGDTLLSAVNKQSRAQICQAAELDKSDPDTVLCEQVGTIQIMKESIAELGIAGLFTGTKARLAHVMLMVVVQLLVYDYIKQLCGIPIVGSQ